MIFEAIIGESPRSKNADSMCQNCSLPNGNAIPQKSPSIGTAARAMKAAFSLKKLPIIGDIKSAKIRSEMPSMTGGNRYE